MPATNRAVLLSTVLLLALTLASCASNEEQAIRHIVTAELIQRHQVPETHIDIVSVSFRNPAQATVLARVFPQGGRIGSPQEYQCELTRDSARWSLVSIAEVAHG